MISSTAPAASRERAPTTAELGAEDPQRNAYANDHRPSDLKGRDPTADRPDGRVEGFVMGTSAGEVGRGPTRGMLSRVERERVGLVGLSLHGLSSPSRIRIK